MFNILQTYLDKTFDILTVGLSSIILEEIYPSLNLDKFTQAFNTFINDLGLYNLKGIIKKEIMLFKNQSFFKNQKPKSLVDNSILICYFCKERPNLVQDINLQWNSQGFDKYTKVCLHCKKNLSKCSVCLQVIEEKKFYDGSIKQLKTSKEKE